MNDDTDIDPAEKKHPNPIVVRVPLDVHEQLAALQRRFAGVPKSVICRRALEIGLEAITADPSRIARPELENIDTKDEP